MNNGKLSDEFYDYLHKLESKYGSIKSLTNTSPELKKLRQLGNVNVVSVKERDRLVYDVDVEYLLVLKGDMHDKDLCDAMDKPYDWWGKKIKKGRMHINDAFEIARFFKVPIEEIIVIDP